MRVTGVREFRKNVPDLVKSEDLVFVTRHGKLASLLVPLDRPENLPPELRRELLTRLGRAISDHLRRRGATEGDILRDFDAWRRKRRANRRRR